MGQRSPLVTLAATAVGLVVLLVVDSTQTGPAPAYTSTAPVTSTPTTTAPATTPPPTPAAAPQQTVTPQAQRTIVYAGRTTKREASVAIAVKGDRAVAYVCDGRRLEAWLTGTFTTGQLALRSRTGERLVGRATAKSAVGTFTLRGRTLHFAISAAGPPAGLYRSASNSRTIGWIVLPDGSQVGVDNDGTPAAAPRLDLASRVASVDGVQVTAQSITGDETF
ncbi:hypothetical protein OG558_35365 [Kribbella sp. NBC_01510]|uniref:hypothetical protein n=1 Tax=Kribbella sp. NBC_01510 TaxID=2903581 RepID=UPI00386C1B0B